MSVTPSKPKWSETSVGVWEFPIPEQYLLDKKEEIDWLFLDRKPVLKLKQISVQSGNKVRAIYAPDEFSKSLYRERLKDLYNIFSTIESKRIAYGFIPARSVVDQAKCHVNYQYTISLDIQDFFDNIKPKLVKGLIPETMIPMLFVNGYPRQGLPTSPMVANIAFNCIDQDIVSYLETFDELVENDRFYRAPFINNKPNFQYTRYADDLSISINQFDIAHRVINGIQRILLKYGFELNSRKTKILSAKNGRRVICGVGVDEINVYPTRKTLKKIRSAIHQSRFSSLHGLRSWVYSIEKKQPK